MPTWPASLPQYLLKEGYSETRVSESLRTEMDAGPTKSRRRFSSAPRPITGIVILNTTQLATLKSFYANDIQGGSLPFDWVDPLDQSAVSMQFLSAPRYSPRGVRIAVNLQLEILP